MPDGSGISYNDHDSTLIGNSFCDSSEEDCTVTLYAHWQIINYTITYSLNNGVAPGNPTTYTIETDTFTLVNPVREGYTFLGWTGSNGSTPQQEVKIEKGSYGNKTYIANWRINKVNIKLIVVSPTEKIELFMLSKLPETIANTIEINIKIGHKIFNIFLPLEQFYSN